MRSGKAARPIHPNIGIELAYRRKLEKLLSEMHESVTYWINANYKKNAARIAQDASPADELQKAINGLAKRWQRRFAKAADELARYFAKAAHARSDAALKKILRDAGISVEFVMTPAMRDIFKATVKANVSLIKSIPQQYMKGVEGAVMRSVQTGRDVGGLKKELEDQYGVQARRATLIAVDQNNKATSAFVKARQQEIGIRRAKWKHSHAGKEPRPTHVANNNKVYDIAKGWYDKDANGKGKGDWIWPGTLINCRCTSQCLIPGVHAGA